MTGLAWPTLSDDEERRASQLHRDAIVFIIHDHEILDTKMADMVSGGVTAKQVHISLDSRAFGSREDFRDSEVTAIRNDHHGFLESALVAMDYIYWQVANSGGKLIVALTPDDILSAKAAGQQALLLGSEGTRLLADRLEVLRMLYRLGLRHLQLSWAFPNSVGTNQTQNTGRGLSSFGRDLITELNALGMIVDVSHLSYQSQYDALETSRTPIVNSHSGALALNPEKPQLLPDELIQAIAARGGVVAVHFVSTMVKPGLEPATLRQLMRQFEYLVDLVGAEHVACGPDYFPLDPPAVSENQGLAPYTFTEGVENISKLQNVTRGLVALGLRDADISAILGGNLLRLFSQATAQRIDAPRDYQPFATGFGACTSGTTPL